MLFSYIIEIIVLRVFFVLSWLFAILIANTGYGHVVDDSVKVVSRKFTSSLSAAFMNSSNWKGNTFGSLSSNCDADYYLMKSKPNSDQLINFKTELSFTKFIDSIWNINSSKLYAQFIWKKNRNRVSQSCNSSVSAQLLNSYIYNYDGVLKMNSKQQSGSFFNPADLSIGYGLGLNFWGKSILSISLASGRLIIQPVYDKSFSTEKLIIGRVSNALVLADYGFSLQVVILKEWHGKIEINCNNKLFCNGLDKKKIQLDLNHKLNYIIWKWIQVRADLKVAYDPLMSLKMQYRNELLFGVFYDSSKKFE